MFVLLIEVDVRPDLLDEFAAAITDNARASVARDPGCLRFEVLQVVDAPTRWVFYEVYADEAAWVQHRASPHFLAYKAVADRALISRKATRMSPIVVGNAS
jgi:quinol monooxygenase YgiN